MSKRAVRACLLSLVFLGIVVGFQNCSGGAEAIRFDFSNLDKAAGENGPHQIDDATKSAFAHQQEERFVLPVSYAEIRDGLEAQLTNLPPLLSAPLIATERTGEAATTCNGLYVLKDWSLPANWATLFYAATLFHSGSLLTQGDPEKPDLSAKLERGFLRIADHMVARANATDFGAAAAQSSSLLGWNNLASPWDAWGNGTCTPSAKPNLWVSALALETIAEAFLLTGELKYQQAFLNGSLYWNSGSSAQYLSQVPSAEAVRQKMSSFGPYAITSTYTVSGGAGNFLNAPSDRMFIRYHYTEEDPGSFSLNTSASMSLAMVIAGLKLPQTHYFMADGRGGTVPRTFPDIGYFSMYPVFVNLKQKNYGYRDQDDPGFFSRAYEGHFEFTAYSLARAGALLRNADFTDAARQSSLQTLAEAPGSVRQTMGIYVCLVRELDPALRAACRDFYSSFKASYGSQNLYGLFAVTAVLSRGLPPK